MKLLVICIMMFLVPGVTWTGDFSAAQKQAAQEHKLIMINFSGSDWCGPCIRLRTEILGSATFEAYASAHLVLVRADFPRQKKNQLSKEQVKLNEALADKYNPAGKFPYTSLPRTPGRDYSGIVTEGPTEWIGAEVWGTAALNIGNSFMNMSTMQGMQQHERQLELGDISVLTLLNSETAYLQATLARTQAQTSRYLDVAAVYQSLGGDLHGQ